ncbi:MAG: hypothetical protein Q9196_006976, partial [Gyalolechia fulgens]
MAMCQDSRMAWVTESSVGIKHRIASSGRDNLMAERSQVIGDDVIHSGTPAGERSGRLTVRKESNEPQWMPNSSHVRKRMWNTTYSKRITVPNATAGVVDEIPGDGQSTSRRPLPAFDSSTGLRWESAPFAPEISAQAVQLSDKVSGKLSLTGQTHSRSGCGSSNNFPAAKTSPTASDLLIPFRDVSVEAERQQLEAQVEEFLASLDRDLYGREINHDKQDGYAALKREREKESAKPTKRARRNPRQEYSMMSSLSRSGKRYYSGPYLEPTALHQQTSYIPVRHLGTGGQGTAHLLKTPRRGSLVVCKVIPHHRSHKYVESELAFLRDALPPHPRIVKIRSALISPIQTQIYLDYYNGGDLTSFVEKYHYGLHSEPIPESFIWHALLQLSEALAYIHHGYDRTASPVTGRQKLPNNWLTVVHRDVKPENILLQRAPRSSDHPGPEAYPRLVLADFGLALQAPELNVLPTSDCAVGTFAWQPPECPHHSTKGDVWALGAVVFNMCTGRLPFDEEMPEWVQD